MNREKTVDAYLQALEKGDYNAMVKLFDSKAMIRSPFFGKIDVMNCYKKLFSHVKKFKVENLHLFEHLKNPDCLTVHYLCTWTFYEGTQVTADCVLVFEFLPSSEKIKGLTVVFDASKMPKVTEKPMRKTA